MVAFHLQKSSSTTACAKPGVAARANNEIARKWFAVFTVPQNERSVTMHLELRQIESFLPTFESVSVWKNRQRVKINRPLFPTYVFARIHAAERTSILRSPGVLRIVGNSQGPIQSRIRRSSFSAPTSAGGG